MNAQKRAILLMLACASLWSIAGIFIKLIPWNPMVITGMRSLLAGCCAAVYMRVKRLRLRLNRSSVFGGTALCCTFFCFVIANKLTTAANAIVLQFTNPVFIIILSAIFLRQRFLRVDIYAVVVTMAGIALFFFDQLTPGSLLGNFVGIGAGLSVACMFLITGHADEESRMSGIVLGHLFCALIGIPFMFVYETPFEPVAVLSILVLGIIQLGIPYVLYGIAVENCPPLACSLLGAVEPLLNPVWVFLFDGEAPGVFALLGGAVVIISVTVWCVAKQRMAQKTVQDA